MITALSVKRLNKHLCFLVADIVYSSNIGKCFLDVDIVENSNIGKESLSKNEIHLNPRGSDKSAIKFIKKIKNFKKII